MNKKDKAAEYLLALKRIAAQLSDIDLRDLTKAERNILRIVTDVYSDVILK